MERASSGDMAIYPEASGTTYNTSGMSDEIIATLAGGCSVERLEAAQ